MIALLFIGLTLGILGVIFAFQNFTPIEVTFLAWHIQGSLAFIIILAALCGALITMLVFLPDIVKKNFRISKLRRKNEELKDKLVDTEIEVESEKNKVVANNAYLDDLQKPPQA